MARTPIATAKLLLTQIATPSLTQPERDNAYGSLQTILARLPSNTTIDEILGGGPQDRVRDLLQREVDMLKGFVERRDDRIEKLEVEGIETDKKLKRQAQELRRLRQQIAELKAEVADAAVVQVPEAAPRRNYAVWTEAEDAWLAEQIRQHIQRDMARTKLSATTRQIIAGFREQFGSDRSTQSVAIRISRLHRA
jgi:hypothetical protein